MQLPDKTLDWPIAWPAVEEIARSEGCRLKAYRCPAGQWTIGYGHTEGVRSGDVISQARADQLLCIDLKLFTESVQQVVSREASSNELGAMVSLAYNIGRAGFAKSTVLRKHNAGDAQSASRAFGLWNKSRGTVLPGLTARRAREAALYLTPDDNAEMPMPRVVDSESSLKTSPIVIAGSVTSISGAAVLLQQFTDQGQAVSAALGVDPLSGVAIALIYAGIKAAHARMKQRMEGWA
jgi:GH24 family phage-related lysozyme (muramidase)